MGNSRKKGQANFNGIEAKFFIDKLEPLKEGENESVREACDGSSGLE